MKSDGNPQLVNEYFSGWLTSEWIKIGMNECTSGWLKEWVSDDDDGGGGNDGDDDASEIVVSMVIMVVML